MYAQKEQATICNPLPHQLPQLSLWVLTFKCEIWCAYVQCIIYMESLCNLDWMGRLFIAIFILYIWNDCCQQAVEYAPGLLCCVLPANIICVFRDDVTVLGAILRYSNILWTVDGMNLMSGFHNRFDIWSAINKHVNRWYVTTTDVDMYVPECTFKIHSLIVAQSLVACMH